MHSCRRQWSCPRNNGTTPSGPPSVPHFDAAAAIMSQPEASLFPPLKPTPDLLKAIRRWRHISLPSPSLTRFLHPYYALHLVAVIVYFPVRELLLPMIDDKFAQGMEFNMDSRESQMFGILAVLLFMKYRRSNTYELWLGKYVLKFSKLACIAAAYVVDKRFFALSVIVYGALVLLGPSEPGYGGPTLVREIGLDYFKRYIDNKKLADPNITYIVQLYSRTAETCTWFESEFAKLSLHYGYDGSSVIFVSISIDAFPVLANQFSLVTPAMNRFEHELPTLLMFQSGVVKARLPEFGRNTMMDEVNIVRGMDLENRARVDPDVLEQIEAKLKQKKSAGAAGGVSNKQKTK